MKKTVLLCCFLTLCIFANARTGRNVELPQPWGGMIQMKTLNRTVYSIQVEYRPTQYEMNAVEITEEGAFGYTGRRLLHTGGLGILFDTPISRNFPVCLDYGLKAVYSGNTFGSGNGKVRYNYLNLTVPVSLLMHANVANTNISFAGFIGLDANFRLIGNRVEYISGTPEYHPLDKALGHRFFNLDWHIGCRLYYSRYFLGIGYQGSVTPVRKNDFTTDGAGGITITLGLTL